MFRFTIRDVLWPAPLLFIACLMLSGCEGRGSMVEFGGMTFGPDNVGKENNWGVKVFSLNKRPFLVMINQGSIGLSRATRDGFDGELVIDDIGLAMDERSIEYSCSTNDGIDGTVLIAGQQFDLRNGNVFLLSAKVKPAEVEQIAVDLSQLPNPGGDPEQLRSLKLMDSRVTAAIDSWQAEK